MSDSPQPTAGPSNEGNLGHAAAGGAVSQFVEAYLQSHGFDKALETYRQGFADAAREGITEGDDDATGRSRATIQGDAVFRAPGPISLEAALKRNLPQAMFPSASTMSDRITPEFEAQAKYSIDSLLKKNEANGGDGKPAEKGEMLLDPSDRIEGYRRYRRWVDDGLDLWKVSHRLCTVAYNQPELDGVSFPLMVYTFLDLMQADFTKAGESAFDDIRLISQHATFWQRICSTIRTSTHRSWPLYLLWVQDIISKSTHIAGVYCEFWFDHKADETGPRSIISKCRATRTISCFSG
jgi:transcription initiation factor TFIID subunit 5